MYFSAIILYFGAEFTKCYAIKFGSEIRPDDYAMIVQTVQVESRNGSLQEHERESENTEKELQKTKEKLDQNKTTGR